MLLTAVARCRGGVIDKGLLAAIGWVCGWAWGRIRSAGGGEEVDDEVDGADEVEMDYGSPGVALCAEGFGGEVELKVLEQR